MSECKQELETGFQSWWKASKYCQVIFPDPHLAQYARDGFAAGHAQATRLLAEKDAEIERLTRERDEAWKAAHNCIQSCVANWVQDKSKEDWLALSRAGEELSDFLCTEAPGDWLDLEWKGAKEAVAAEERAEAAEAEVARLMALMRTARAVMRECGWHLAAAAEPNGDGVLEMACTEVEADFASALSSGE